MCLNSEIGCLFLDRVPQCRGPERAPPGLFSVKVSPVSLAQSERVLFLSDHCCLHPLAQWSRGLSVDS